MGRPVIGISGSSFLVNGQYEVQMCGRTNMEAVARQADCTPIMLPAIPDLTTVHELVDLCDGFVFTGARANIHPSFFGHEATPAYGDFDLDRDNLCLPLIREAVERGVPVLGLCRGFQEVNVAFGGSLHPEVRELPGKMNHRMPPDADTEARIALRHSVSFTKGSVFERLYGQSEIQVNSLHGQAILEPGARIRIDGVAPDGVAEAISVEGAASFALGVQWHPELGAEDDQHSQALFRAFGAAARGEWSAARAA